MIVIGDNRFTTQYILVKPNEKKILDLMELRGKDVIEINDFKLEVEE